MNKKIPVENARKKNNMGGKKPSRKTITWKADLLKRKNKYRKLETAHIKNLTIIM